MARPALAGECTPPTPPPDPLTRKPPSSGGGFAVPKEREMNFTDRSDWIALFVCMCLVAGLFAYWVALG